MLQSTNCDTGDVCVDLTDTSAECQPADICDNFDKPCSWETFLAKCCADRTRFAACLYEKLDIFQCNTKGSCLNDGLIVSCK